MDLLNYLINFLMLPNGGLVLKTNGKKFGVRDTQSVPNLICFACQAGRDYLTVVSNKKSCSFGDKVVPF